MKVYDVIMSTLNDYGDISIREYDHVALFHKCEDAEKYTKDIEQLLSRKTDRITIVEREVE